MKRCGREGTVYWIKQTAFVIIMASLLFALFSGCRTQKMPDSTTMSSENEQHETTSLPDGTKGEENTADKDMDIPFYYMIYTVSNGYSGVMEVPDEGTLGAPYHRVVIRNEEELHSDALYKATVVSLGLSSNMLEYVSEWIGKIMEDRYTEEYFDSHDLLIYYIEEPGGSYYHDVAALRKAGDKTEMTIRCYLPSYGSDEACRIRMTLVEVPKGYFPEGAKFPDILKEEVEPEDPLYTGLEEARYHRFPEGIMEDVH